MAGKGHVTKHHIEMYLGGKLSKVKLETLKDKFKKELMSEKRILTKYKIEDEQFVYEEEYNNYINKNKKYIEILSALKKIYPKDKELFSLEI